MKVARPFVEPSAAALPMLDRFAVVITVPVTAGNVIVPDAAAVARKVVVPLLDPAIVNPPDPIAGVVRLGLLAKTRAPVPVSSLMTPASSEDEVAANTLSLLAV